MGSSATCGSLDTKIGTSSGFVMVESFPSVNSASTQPMNGISVWLAATPTRMFEPISSLRGLTVLCGRCSLLHFSLIMVA